MRLLKSSRGRALLLGVAALLASALAAGCGQSAPAPGPMEVTHASYLDLSTNISDLRSRVTEWQKGDEGSLKIAEEKLERIQTVIGATGWPKLMSAPIARTKAAVEPMAKALKAQDQAAAEAASKEFGDASHDVTHAFYGDWIPAEMGTQGSSMAAHVIYLDIAANIADMQSRVSQWQKGDESSINVVKEKAERTEALLRHMYPTGVMARRLPAIQIALPAVFDAVESKDVAAAQRAVKPVAEAARQMTIDAYTWMDIARAGNDPACVQASYLDISRSISDLRAGVTAWQKGDEAGLKAAREGLARVDILVGHAAWPNDMADAIERTRSAVWLMDDALTKKDVAAAVSASAEFGEASHDVTHSYYGDWLARGGLKAVKAAGAPGGQKQAQTASAGGHAHDGAPSTAGAPAEGPDWTVIGAFAAAFAAVIGTAALTRPRGRQPRNEPLAG